MGWVLAGEDFWSRKTGQERSRAGLQADKSFTRGKRKGKKKRWEEAKQNTCIIEKLKLAGKLRCWQVCRGAVGCREQQLCLLQVVVRLLGLLVCAGESLGWGEMNKCSVTAHQKTLEELGREKAINSAARGGFRVVR